MSHWKCAISPVWERSIFVTLRLPLNHLTSHCWQASSYKKPYLITSSKMLPTLLLSALALSLPKLTKCSTKNSAVLSTRIHVLPAWKLDIFCCQGQRSRSEGPQSGVLNSAITICIHTASLVNVRDIVCTGGINIFQTRKPRTRKLQ